MAEAPRNRVPSGYDEAFVDAVEDDFQCLICHLPLKEPVLTRCGHRFCKECLEEHFRRQEAQEQPITCPADRRGLDRDRDVFPDLATERKILSFAIKCPSEGCEWTGELRSKEIHMASCLFKLVQCTNENCHVAIQRRELEEHVVINCRWRILACDHCSEQHPECNMKKHFDICRRFPVLCTNKCGVRDIPREKLEVHIRDECPATEVQCEYKNLGCEEEFPRSGAKSHSKTQIESHLNLALRALEATQHQVKELVTVVKDQSQQIERQSLQIERQSQQIEQQSVEIERLMLKDREQTPQIEQLMSKDKEKSQQIERLMSAFRDQSQQVGPLISKDIAKSTLGEQLVSTTATDYPPRQRVPGGPTNLIYPTSFEWKIPNLGAVLERARLALESVVSKPFYLFGYKYLMKISGEISSNLTGWEPMVMLWMYIKVVPGEFDESLSWPCKEKVRVTLVSHHAAMDNWKNISGLIDFDKGVEPCSRPLHNDHYEYRLIRTVSFLTLPFVKDDTILIRVNRE